MHFSVIIPTRNSGASLELTLRALEQQIYPAYEIIVADGCSGDNTRQIGQRFGARVIDNPAIHAAGGRNRGAAIAQGDWLAFTDSDCQPSPEWLDTARKLISAQPDLVALGGPLRPLPPVNEIERVAGDALLSGVLQFPNDQRCIYNRSLQGAFITANAFYRRDWFNLFGGFDERFANYGEDIDLFWRAVAACPGQLLYDPRLYMAHRFPTTRAQLCRKWFQYGMASCHLQRRYLGWFRIDISHYRRLAAALSDLVAQPDQRQTNLARVVQIMGHLIGKYCGSVILGIVNL